jgi:hypothetical protein
MLDVLPGASVPTEVRLAGAARLTVRVLERGEPARKVAVTLEAASGPAQRLGSKLDAAGTCQFEPLAPGAWRWSLDTERAASSGTLALAAGESRRLELDLDRDPIRFRLRGEDAGMLVTEASAWSLGAAAPIATARASRCGPGGFELDLGPGRYLFLVGGVLDGAEPPAQQRTAVLDVVSGEREIELSSSTAGIVLQAGGARDGSAPVATLLAVDGRELAGSALTLPVLPTRSGWRCPSVPAGALVRIRGLLDSGSVVERELLVPARGDLEVEWR